MNDSIGFLIGREVINNDGRLWELKQSQYHLVDNVPLFDNPTLGSSHLVISNGRLYSLIHRSFTNIPGIFKQILPHGNGSYSCLRDDGHLLLISREGDNYKILPILDNVNLIVGSTTGYNCYLIADYKQWLILTIDYNEQFKVDIRETGIHYSPDASVLQCGIVYTNKEVLIHRYDRLYSLTVTNVRSAALHMSLLIVIYHDGTAEVFDGKYYNNEGEFKKDMELTRIINERSSIWSMALGNHLLVDRHGYVHEWVIEEDRSRWIILDVTPHMFADRNPMVKSARVD